MGQKIMNKELIEQLEKKATEDILGVNVLNPKCFAALVVEECAKIIEAQDVDPAFKHRMSRAMKEKFGVEE
jgi:hypothetical protein